MHDLTFDHGVVKREVVRGEEHLARGGRGVLGAGAARSQSGVLLGVIQCSLRAAAPLPGQEFVMGFRS